MVSWHFSSSEISNESSSKEILNRFFVNEETTENMMFFQKKHQVILECKWKHLHKNLIKSLSQETGMSVLCTHSYKVPQIKSCTKPPGARLCCKSKFLGTFTKCQKMT
jgi:hypothetical protein